MTPGLSVERDEEQGLYPIRTVSALTGVNPVTLRAWERRYGLVRPQRTPKGHRLYTEADIERIRSILSLLDQGIPIGQTHRLLDAATPRQEPSRSDAPPPGVDCRERLRAAVEALDEWAVNTVYDEALSVHAIDQVTHGLLAPLLRELRAAPESRAAAGFLGAYLCNKLGARLHHESPRARGPRLVAAGLPGERADVELLLFSLAAIHRGYQVISLGSDMTLSALPGAVDRSQARGVVLFGDVPGGGGELRDRGLTTLITACDAPVFVSVKASRIDSDGLRASGVSVLPGDIDKALGLLDEILGG